MPNTSSMMMVFAAAIMLTCTSAKELKQPPVPAVALKPTRTVLLRHDLMMAGYEALLIRNDMPPGAREGRHTHPGMAFGHVEVGTYTLEHEGRPTATYKAGDSFVIEDGKVHEGMNLGTDPVRVIGIFMVEKGKPLATKLDDAK